MVSFVLSMIEVSGSDCPPGLPTKRIDMFRTLEEADALKAVYYAAIDAKVDLRVAEWDWKDKKIFTLFGNDTVWGYAYDPYERGSGNETTLNREVHLHCDWSVERVHSKCGYDVAAYYSMWLPFYIYRDWPPGGRNIRAVANRDYYPRVAFGAPADLEPRDEALTETEIAADANTKVVSDGLYLRKKYLCHRLRLGDTLDLSKW